MPTVLLAGPSLLAISGVSTHLNQLLASKLASEVNFLHFQVGSEGRHESWLGRLSRPVGSPMELLQVIRTHRPDIVHLSSSMDPKAFWLDIVYVAVCRRARVGTVFQVHGGALPQDFCLGRPLRCWSLRWGRSSAGTVVVLSELEGRAYEELLPTLSIRVVPNAVECYAFPGNVPRNATRSSELNTLFLGRLVLPKGVYEAIKATAVLIDQGVPVRLVLVGSGTEEAAIRASIFAVGAAQNIFCWDR